jgi:cytochrome c-type biogenesis protein CcmE
MELRARHRRFAWIAAGVLALAAVATLVLNAFRSNLVFFYTPTQVFANEAPKGRSFRIGGLVEQGSVVRSTSSVEVRFRVTDNARAIGVVYNGILPDLFKEGKGVVAQGALGTDGTFVASQVLAKHDENYMPPEAAEALRKAGHPVGVPEQFVDKARSTVKN